MNWEVQLSKEAEEFIKKHKFQLNDLFELLKKALRYFKGEKININIRKLRGKWQGFFRIRKGKIRIIAEFNFDDKTIFVERIGWRGKVYNK